MISRRMLFACAAGIVAGTDSPAETKPGSDNYAVKVPVSDGSRDVTAAFLDALKAHGRVYVPEGMYRIDSRVDLSRLYGPGFSPLTPDTRWRSRRRRIRRHLIRCSSPI